MAPPTICVIIDAYLRHCAVVGKHSAESRAERERTFGWFCAEFGGMLVTDCRAYMLSDWIESRSGWKSTATRKARANMVNAAFNWAVRQDRIAKNPFRSVSYAEAEPRPPMPDEDLATICAKANKPYERILRVLRWTGCRVSELCELLWPDVDFERGLLTIKKHKSRGHTHQDKTVLLPQDAIHFLSQLHAENPGDGHVFLNNRGRAWNRRTLGQQLRRMKRRGLVTTDATLHGLRHQYGHTSLREGESIALVSENLGHSSIAITHKFYGHLATDLEARRRAAERAKPR